MSADVERAIATIEESRETHVEWLAWQESTPDWREQLTARPRPDAVGGPEHHRSAIEGYDHVLAVLRSLATPESGEPS